MSHTRTPNHSHKFNFKRFVVAAWPLISLEPPARMKHEKKEETQLQEVPTDVISSMQFAPSSNQYLAISSWDGTVRLFDIQNPTKYRQKFGFDSPVLDIAFTVSDSIDWPS